MSPQLVVTVAVQTASSASAWSGTSSNCRGEVGIAGGSTHSPGGGGSHAALVVDAVSDVFGTGGADVKPAPPLGAGDELRGIEGVTSYDGTLVFVLDARSFGALAREALSQAPPSMHAAAGAGR